MRSSLLAVVLALAVVSAATAAPISSLNTNSAVPTASGANGIIVAQCLASGNRLTGTAISAANNNNCALPLYYITNACDPSSAIAPFPSSGTFPGTVIPIPQNQYVCALPTTAQAGKHTCVSSEAGVCPTFPQGNLAVATDRWAVPRPLLGSTTYPAISRGTFTVFPLNAGAFPISGADGTYVFPTDIPSLQPFSTQATSFGTAQFDFKCRSAGPANSRAIVCTDGTNQNYFSAPLNYGFSPASRSATTFMTYGRGFQLGKEGTLSNGQMSNKNFVIYARYQNYAAANNDPLPAFPQKVTQPVKPVYAFDPYARPSPAFVKIAASVDSFIANGIERLRLIGENVNSLGASATQLQKDQVTAHTFRGFYKGEQIGRSKTNGNFYGGVYYSPDEPTLDEAQIDDGYSKQPTWSGCYGHGKYLATESAAAGADVFEQFPVGGTITPGFVDPRFTVNSAASFLPGPSGQSFPAQYTCNDWTFYLDTSSSGTRVLGAVGDPGIRFYTSGNPNTAFFQPSEGLQSDQKYVTYWLSDNLPPQACNTPNQNVYCSWFPTNTDGVKNGDETGIDCGGTTLGADNQGLPTPSCGCTAGFFYDYYNALCIPCIQDTYCNNPTGCVGECYPCFTAPTSGAALSGGQIGAAAVWPNGFANPQNNNLNSNDQTAGVGAVNPQESSPKATPFGEQFNENGENVILVGTTFNQLTQRYDRAATSCYCNIGFQAATNTATNPGTPLTVSDPDAKFVNAPGWLPSGSAATNNFNAGFKATNGALATQGPFDGSNCVPVVRGDPEITGLQGQSFQVHGIPDEFFNLVSHPSLQVNSHFVFLEDARCDNYTTCFSHAGTYIDQIGIQVEGQKIKVTAGAMEEGLRVFVDGKEIAVGDKKQLKAARVFFSAQRKVHIRTALFSFAFVASDKFMNQEIALLDGKLAKLGSKLVTLKAGEERPHSEIPLHGIVGQTWQNLQYPDNMMIEGAVADYRIEESDLFGNSFAFNKFQL